MSSNAALISMISTFAIGLISGASLNFIFSMIGSLQFILYLTIFNLDIPGNLNVVFAKLIAIMTFDWIPEKWIEPYLNWVAAPSTHLNDDLSEYFTNRFPQLGYHNSNPVTNLNSAALPIFILIVLFLTLPPLVCVLRYCKVKARH